MDSHSKSRRIGLSVSCAFFLVLTDLVAQPSGVSPFLPPQSTVVLLVGMPGDIESENTYRDQLQTWLDIVTGSGTRHRVFVLCDNPESFSLPENREGSGGVSPAITNSQSPITSDQPPITNHLSPVFLHADRSNFLRLAEMVPAASRSFVLIAEIRKLVDSDGIMTSDEDHPQDIVKRTLECLELMLGRCAAHATIRTATEGEGDSEDLLRPWIDGQFWKYHFQLYRKRPVYWPLQSPKKKFTIWISHEQFSKDTLFRVKDQFVQVKINWLNSL